VVSFFLAFQPKSYIRSIYSSSTHAYYMPCPSHPLIIQTVKILFSKKKGIYLFILILWDYGFLTKFRQKKVLNHWYK
jgi:hypothetical protein